MNRLYLSALACAGLLLSSGPVWASGDAAAGEAKAESCAMCHGDDGMGDEKYPAIKGLSEADFIKAMQEYANGTRSHKMMQKAAKKLSEQDIADLAAYYAQ